MLTLRSTCELCGQRSFFSYSSADGFTLCGRCAKLHKHTTTPIGELVAQRILQDKAAEGQKALQDEATRSARRSRRGVLGMAGLLVGGYFYFLHPESCRTGLQVPVIATLRSSRMGVGNVILVANKSNLPLKNVVLTVRNPGKNAGLRHDFGEIAPGATVELGTVDWGWTFERGEKVTITADDFLPIVFTTEQLGLK